MLQDLNTYEKLKEALDAGQEVLVTGADGTPKLRPTDTPPTSKALFKSAYDAGWRFKVEGG